MGRRLSQRPRTLAAPQTTRLRRFASGGHGMGEPGRRAEQVSDPQLRKIPAARTLAKLMTTKRNHLTKGETVTVAAVEKAVPILANARVLIDRFQTMIRNKSATELEPWIVESRRQPHCLVRERHRPRQVGGARRHHTALVKRPSRSSDH